MSKFPKQGNQRGSGRNEDMVKGGSNTGKFAHRSAWQTPFDHTDKTRGRVDHLNLKRRNFGINFVPSIANGAASSLPKSTTFAASKHSLQKTIARWVPAGGGGSAVATTVKASIYTPSNRLRVSVTVACEADSQSPGDPSSTDTVPTFKIQAVSRNPETGKESLLRQIFPASGTKVAPDAYEADTAATEMRVDFSLTDFTATLPGWLTSGGSGNMILIVQWEPNTPIDEHELRELYNRCSVTAPTTVLMQNNG
jgi:hypothetical protein